MSIKRCPNSNPTPNIPGFVFSELLGRGTYATVYKAYKRNRVISSDQLVAIKCVLKSSLSKAGCDNLITEISILKKIKHQFIVELIDFQWDDHYIYLIFEYCAGGELSKFIKTHQRLSEGLVRHFLQQLASGLQILRKYNIAHMDLKPQNILLSSKPSQKSRNVTLKIADFGFSQILRDNDTCTSMRGSPLYMAPEILLKDTYDARVDLWSVGIILYECLYGEAPYHSDTFAELAEKIKDNKPIELPSTIQLSPMCRNLLSKLLKREPDERITFEEFFNHPFLDLEHMPSPESYNKGVSLISSAVDEDKKGNYKKAYESYVKGVEYLIPVHDWCDEDGICDTDCKRRLLRKKIVEYINRAEELKKSQCIQNGLTEEDDAIIQKAIVDAFDADELADIGCYNESLIKYNNALEILVPMVSRLSGEERELLYNEVVEWLSKAEKVKIISKRSNKMKKPRETTRKRRNRNLFPNPSNFHNFNGSETLPAPNCFVQ